MPLDPPSFGIVPAASGPVRTPLRERITAAARPPEPECLARLLPLAALPPGLEEDARRLARRLAESLRRKGTAGPVEGLMREYALSSQEGVALMCLAEALLRIPDHQTRDALIRDKIGGGEWRAHLGHSPSLFVNAATWGLVVTGRLARAESERTLSAALARLIRHGGETLIRRGVDMTMRLLGEQFVLGQTIEEALENSRRLEALGFRYSYDMLGEAAMTDADARRYLAEYEHAIDVIGRSSNRRGVMDGAGISIKLSALHPRYTRSQRERVMTELLPRLRPLALRARAYDVGLNIDAEECDRLELSLDLLEALCDDPALAGWNGVGFVVQSYQKRAIFVVEHLIELARRSRHRLMVRLVKGAYWDTEIKRAQVDGLDDMPVFTRKPHTDVSYLACARTLLDAPDAVFPQFATHNAHTLAAIYTMAGQDFRPGDYEFQCLHGMGEALYEEIVGPDKLGRPCRIYAPVGTHETLLAYLVRRLLENGANSSFVNRINDPSVAIDDLVVHPVPHVRRANPALLPHAGISHPSALFAPARPNARGFDLANEHSLAELARALEASAARQWRAAPPGGSDERAEEIRNPADRRDVVGHVVEATAADVDAAVARALACQWGGAPASDRASCLFRAADLLEGRMLELVGLIVREAGRTLPNAVSELREAVDFLRYYAVAARDDMPLARPLGPVVCISPWNFPLAIFTGQIAAALASGNPVLAKPAEETPLIAAEAVRLLHEAGIPPDALQLLPGSGDTGARLVADARVACVVFTGSTAVARAIQRQLAERLGPDGRPVPLIAETGGQNAMIVDSSALPEQVVADVLASAFDSAGQRCSALRVLCLQDDVADRMLAMLKGAMAELAVGDPSRLSTDIGPVIGDEAARGIAAHIEAMRAAGRPVHSLALPPGCEHGSFVAPALIEIGSVGELREEIFGPVLHVLRWRRDTLDELVDAIGGTGYGLTFGLHTRLDDTVERVLARAQAGNIYVNRNLVGAVVGTQPFGGHGLSGTGPKAGGPLYLRRLCADGSAPPPPPGRAPAIASEWRAWLAAIGAAEAAADAAACAAATPLGVSLDLPGPVGERNTYTLEPRGAVLCVASGEQALWRQISAALSTGNRVLVAAPAPSRLAGLPSSLAQWIGTTADHRREPVQAALFEGDPAGLLALGRAMAEREGAIIPVHVGRAHAEPGRSYALEWLLRERTVSVNTTAAGGNASLMTMEESHPDTLTPAAKPRDQGRKRRAEAVRTGTGDRRNEQRPGTD